MVGHDIWRETLKNREKETQTVEPGKQQETVTNVKYDKYTLQNLDCGNKLSYVENETQTLYDLEYDKTLKNVQNEKYTRRTWIMARRLKKA